MSKLRALTEVALGIDALLPRKRLLDLRLDDVILLSDLRDRIRRQLSLPRNSSAEDQLHSDVSAALELLRDINRRGTLQEHDKKIARQLLEELRNADRERRTPKARLFEFLLGYRQLLDIAIEELASGETSRTMLAQIENFLMILAND
jgi:hypothetical protein